MRTFSKKTSGLRDRAHGAARAVQRRIDSRRARGEDGFLLVEVMMSSLMVALIVVATFNGLDVATKISADQRRHDQAAVLAAQSQEQLRSEPASALDALETSPHRYSRTIGGTTYTITQEAKAAGVVGKESTVGCSVTSTTSETHNVQISSSVTWPQLEAVKRPAVKEASVITPPTGSAIEVDVINGLNAGVPGITAKATYRPTGSGSSNTIEGTTDAAGCVVFSGIQATEATVEIAERTGYVTRSGALKVAPKKLTIAPNVTTHDLVSYAEAGRIAARFTYKGETKWEGKEVVGDTFVAQQAEEFEGEPKYEVGATYFEYETTGEERFTPVLGDCNTATACVPRNKTVPAYEPTAYTAAGSKYPNGDLFPFKAAWRVWAGDCEANAVGEAVASTKPVVTSGTTATVNVPLAYTQLSVYKGTPKEAEEGKEAFEEERLGPVQITNEACESAAVPPNAKTQTFVHEQKESLPKGRLEEPFQPFGQFQLCLVDKKLNKTYTIAFKNEKVATPATPKIFLNQRPNSEVSSERAAKEAEYKAKEIYKEKSIYSNKQVEAEAEKTKYEVEKENYEEALTSYNTAKTNYNNAKSKYSTEKTKYETKKTAYENKKAEYEKTAAQGGKKASQKNEYELFKTEYEAALTAYKKYETEYKTFETEYKNFETQYKKYETEYKKFETNYKTDEKQYAEYQGYQAYVAAKAAYEKAKTEEKEAEKSGVTTKSGTEC